MISVADLKEHLNVTHALQDDYIGELEAAAVDVAEQYFGYLGEPEATTIYLLGYGTTDLFLPDVPAADPAVAVTEAAYPGDTAGAVTDFVVRGNRLYRQDGWTQGYEYAVTYTRGYAAGAEPERAKQAVRLLVGHWYMNRTPVSQANATELPLTVQELMPYRPVIA